jgi:hypothetical protein
MPLSVTSSSTQCPGDAHGVNGVEDEVGEGVADLALGALDAGEVGGELGLQLDHGALALGRVAPARPGEVQHLAHHLVEVYIRLRPVGFARAVELTHPGHRLRDVVDGTLDGDEIPAALFADVRFAFQQGLCVQRNG